MHSGVRRRRLLPSDRADGLYSSGGQQYYHLPFSVLIIIFASITLSTILINERNVSSFIEAVEPPSVPSTSKNRASPNLNIVSHNHNNDNNNEQHNIIDKEVKADQRDEKMIVENRQSIEENDKKKEPSSSRRQRKMQRWQNKEKRHTNIPNNSIIDGKKQQQHQQQQQQSSQADFDAYMNWCHKVLGIKSVVEIKEFEYLDHLQLLTQSWESEVEEYSSGGNQFDWLEKYYSKQSTENANSIVSDDNDEPDELPTKLVRGLAAKDDIEIGDVVISIPLFSLLSIPTTIDHDPVLSRILGPTARQAYGWEESSEYEIPLLVLAVLYHRSLGSDSPISHYIDILLQTSTDSFPFLWSDRELREEMGDSVGGEGVKKLTRGIRQDLLIMYDEVMGTLVREQPDTFAPPDDYNHAVDSDSSDIEWVYSYENFSWAFALVISRHHYLPIQAFDDDDGSIGKSVKRSEDSIKRPSPKLADYPSLMHETLSSVNEVVPPANQPTDSWVDEAHNEERVVEDDMVANDDDLTFQQQSITPVKHSFLAPLADLINFGPPCLTGSYNEGEVSVIEFCLLM